MVSEQFLSSALGALQGEHNRARKFFALAIIGIVFTLLLALGLIALILFAEPSGNPKDTVAAYALVCLCLVFCAGCAFVLLSQRNARVRIYEHGLIYERGVKSQIFLWNEIELFWTKIVDHYVNGVLIRTSDYTLQKASGEKLRLFHSIENIEQIGRRIDEEMFCRIFPRDLQTIKSGSSVPFGKFILTPEGMQKNINFIRWQDIKAMETREGKIIIKNRNGKIWASVLRSRIPNASVFLRVAEEIQRANES